MMFVVIIIYVTYETTRQAAIKSIMRWREFDQNSKTYVVVEQDKYNQYKFAFEEQQRCKARNEKLDECDHEINLNCKYILDLLVQRKKIINENS